MGSVSLINGHIDEPRKQYCRYCTHLVTGNGIYCAAKKKEMAESTAKSVNHCKIFEFNCIDAFFETDGYKPKKVKEITNSQQMCLESEVQGE